MKIYISGKITGYKIEEAEKKFKASENLLLNLGYQAVNPFNLSETHPDKKWSDYMIEDIKALFQCDAIYLHNDWRQSQGARIEYAIAVEMGHRIFEEGYL